MGGNSVSRMWFVVCISAAFISWMGRAAPRQQIIGIPAGLEVSTSGSTVKAFCLEHNVSGFPDSSVALPHATGRVRISFTDATREPRVLSTQEAVDGKFVQFAGSAPNQHYCATVMLGQGVKSVHFLEPVALGQEEIKLSRQSWDQIHEQAKELLGRVDLAEIGDYENQRRVHLNRQLMLEDVAENGTIRVYRTANCDPARSMQATFFRLKSQGDTSLIRSPGGAYVLHDVGASQDEMESILAAVEPDQSGVKRIFVCITHPDYDHYRGLSWLLDQQAQSNGKIVVENIVVGALPSKVKDEAERNPGGRFGKVAKRLLEEYDLPDPTKGYTHFVNKSHGVKSVDIIGSKDTGKALRARIDSMDFDILQFPAPDAGTEAAEQEHRHVRNIVSRAANKDFSIADYGDAMPQHFREMLVMPSELSARRLERTIERKTIEAELLKEEVGFLQKGTGPNEIFKEFPDRLQAKASEYFEKSVRWKTTLKPDRSNFMECLEWITDAGDAYDRIIREQPNLRRLLAKLDALIDARVQHLTQDDVPKLQKRLTQAKVELGDLGQRLVTLNAEAGKEAASPNTVILEGRPLEARYSDFRAQVAKWPHHAWMPRDAGEKGIMKAWLKTYRPEVLLVNVPLDPAEPAKWQASRDRLKEISALLEEAREEEKAAGRILPTKLMTTEESGRRFEALMRWLEALGLC